LWHHGVDIDRGHAFLDRALHTQQTDAILIFHQLADRPHPAIAEMIDVIDLARAVAQIDERADHRDDVVATKHPHRIGRVEIETHVHLYAAYSRKVVALGIEEQRTEHCLGGFHGRGFARPHHAIDIEQRV